MTEPSSRQSPIFTKSYDFILWLLEHTEKFPKSERFRLARRLEDSVFAFYELLIQTTRSPRKPYLLLKADVELEKVRLYIRMAEARQLINPRQYHHAAERLTEIGKLLGGWLKSVS